MLQRFWRPARSRPSGQPLCCQFIITSMPVGGAETLLVNLLHRINPDVVRAEVICLKEPGPLGETLANEFPVHSRLIRGKWDVGVVARLAKLMRSRRTDAVVTIGAGDKMFWGRLAAFIARVPVIASALHSTGWPDGVGRLNRLLTPITDAFIAVADSHGRFLRDFERFPASKIRVIRNGVDCDRFQPNDDARLQVRRELGLSADSLVVGIVAALRHEKNHQLLVRVAADLRKEFKQLHWLVIGEGPERTSIESLAKQLGVTDRVHLLGTRHDTERLVAALDVFTLCSLNEASPVSILEALACGVPVAASKVGSVPETVIEGETGWLFDSGDQQQMGESIASLLRDPKMRSCYGDQGRFKVLETGSLEAMVRGYEALVTESFEAARVTQESRRRSTAPSNLSAGPMVKQCQPLKR
ncbi:MAG: glycosyltransferase [Planctomycetota bacterium]